MGGNRKTRVAAVGLAVSLAVVPAACGSSDDGVTATATTAKPAATTSTTAASTKPQTIKVTGSDYKFTGLPETAPAGSKISSPLTRAASHTNSLPFTCQRAKPALPRRSVRSRARTWRPSLRESRPW